MNDFLTNIKRDLEEMSNENITVTLSRKDVEMLVKSYEKKSELLIKKIADEQKGVIEKLTKDKIPVKVKNGIIQITKEHPDYDFLMEDD